MTDWRNPDGSMPIAQTRDFRTIDEMNEAIVVGINNCVGIDDVLIHAGDWSFGGYENIQKFWDRLICKNIHLVLGNHDSHIKKNREGVRDLFLSVNDRLEIQFNKKLIIVDHYPLSSWEEMRKGAIMLHGHCHLNNENKFGIGRRMDVGLDGSLNFSPYIILDECVKLLEKRAIASELDNDHHLDKVVGKKG